MILAINALRARSGGAIAHLKGIIENLQPEKYDISSVQVWVCKSLIKQLPQKAWLQVHCPTVTQKNIFSQLLWEKFVLPFELKKHKCKILLNVDAGSVCYRHPFVTISQDMLSYEPGEMNRYGWSFARLRLLVLKYIQSASLKQANGSIFLTHYAGNTIQKSIGLLDNVRYIPHGISDNFKLCVNTADWDHEKDIQLLYVSNSAPYKHQWHVVEAVSLLRKKGYKVGLQLVGGSNGQSKKRLDDAVRTYDPNHSFVQLFPFVTNHDVLSFLSRAHIFLFASSCENMPITLLEAMAVGLPIACSNRGPMPEVLQDGGTYFDPENPETISEAVQQLLEDPSVRRQYARRAKELAAQYSWSRCSHETFKFIKTTMDRYTQD
jgi:glycosyltransferase involved in cell wall biosynthesis